MAPFLGAEHTHAVDATQGNALLAGTRSALHQLLAKAHDYLPGEALPHIASVHFSTANTGSPYFPSPLKQTEAISALKAVEAGVASAIADLHSHQRQRAIAVDLERATAFLFSTYLTTVGGLDKSSPKVRKLLKGEHDKLCQACGGTPDHTQTPTSSKHSLFCTGGCLQICTRPRTLESTFISMARSRPQKHSTWSVSRASGPT